MENIGFYDKKITWFLFDREECKDMNVIVLDFL
jgi:hypothetical protein